MSVIFMSVYLVLDILNKVYDIANICFCSRLVYDVQKISLQCCLCFFIVIVTSVTLSNIVRQRYCCSLVLLLHYVKNGNGITDGNNRPQSSNGFTLFTPYQLLLFFTSAFFQIICNYFSKETAAFIPFLTPIRDSKETLLIGNIVCLHIKNTFHTYQMFCFRT